MKELQSTTILEMNRQAYLLSVPGPNAPNAIDFKPNYGCGSSLFSSSLSSLKGGSSCRPSWANLRICEDGAATDVLIFDITRRLSLEN
jgi:hypothetical protein